MAASFIDGIIISIGINLIGGLVGVFYGLADSTIEGFILLFFFLVIIWNWLYFAILESSAQQATPGKMAMSLV